MDKATVVKAVSILNNEVRSETVSKVYFVGLQQSVSCKNLSVMNITINPDDLFDYYKGIYKIGNVYHIYRERYDLASLPDNYIYSDTNYAKEGKGWERVATIDYFIENHDFCFSQRIGIRIHGGWSTEFNQKSFNLYARDEYDGNNQFKYNFFGKKYNKIMLRAGGFRDIYATKIRDVLNQRLVKDRSVGTQNGIPCVVFINGEYWGLYNLQETIGDSYISEKFGVNSDNILIIKKNVPSVYVDANNYNDLLLFAQENDLSVEENYRYIEKKIDLQSYIDYMVFEIYMPTVILLVIILRIGELLTRRTVRMVTVNGDTCCLILMTQMEWSLSSQTIKWIHLLKDTGLQTP